MLPVAIEPLTFADWWMLLFLMREMSWCDLTPYADLDLSPGAVAASVARVRRLMRDEI